MHINNTVCENVFATGQGRPVASFSVSVKHKLCMLDLFILFALHEEHGYLLMHLRHGCGHDLLLRPSVSESQPIRG